MKNTFHCCFDYKENEKKAHVSLATDFNIECLEREEAVNFYYCMEKTMEMLDSMFCICADNKGLDKIYEVQ